MTKEMIHNELMERVETFNRVSEDYTKFKNKFGVESEVFEESLRELGEMIQHLGALEEIYD